MSREWRPGDVALVEVGCQANRHVGIFDGGGWRYGPGKWTSDDPAIVTARPLAVIDPNDRQQIERLLIAYYGVQPSGYRIHKMQAALREYADPKPPKPEEPTGLGAVVEDAEGVRFVRTGVVGWEWTQVGTGGPICWAHIDVVRVLSEGVAE